MADGRQPLPDPHPRCHCGGKAVIGFYPARGPSRFFCEVHQTDAGKLADAAGLSKTASTAVTNSASLNSLEPVS